MKHLDSRPTISTFNNFPEYFEIWYNQVMQTENPNEPESPAEDVAEGAVPENFPYDAPTKLDIGLGISE